MNDKAVIKALGGPTAVARRLGYKLPKGAARVANWMRRGIPSQVRLENLGLFLSAEKTLTDSHKAAAR